MVLILDLAAEGGWWLGNEHLQLLMRYYPDFKDILSCLIEIGVLSAAKLQDYRQRCQLAEMLISARMTLGQLKKPPFLSWKISLAELESVKPEGYLLSPDSLTASYARTYRMKAYKEYRKSWR